MWRLGRIAELIRGKDRNIRSAVVRVYNNGKSVNIRRQIKPGFIRSGKVRGKGSFLLWSGKVRESQGSLQCLGAK